MELIRSIVRVGNSAGVILPREWLNGKAKIQLIEKPIDIKNEIFEILDDYLPDIIGLYIVGSYARGEETGKSDVDILAITNNTDKHIDNGKYNIILISKDKIEQALQKNILPILPMIKEAKALLNDELIESYKNTPLTRKNLDWHIEGTKSILKVNRESIGLSKEMFSKFVGDAVAYSLVLNLRSMYIVNCLKIGKLWSNKELLRLIKGITGSLMAYEGYIRVKSNQRKKEDFPIEEAEKLYNYVYSKIKEQERWVKAKKE